MTQFFLRTCDRAGHVLNDSCVHAGDVYAALALANRRLGDILRRGDASLLGSVSRIDVTDNEGHTVARLMRSEAIAGMS
jgi:hypothetical protein